MPVLDFEFYAGGIEDAIVAQLTTGMPGVPVDTYSGQLDDAKEVERAVSTKGRKFPLVMVSYADGEDSRAPGYSPVAGRPLTFRHDCFFAVICLSNDARGEQVRRRGSGKADKGLYGMLGTVDQILTGLRFEKTVEDETYLLTVDPIEPVSVEYVPLPNMTGYARIYATAFKWSSPDRRPEPIDVDELQLTVSSLNQPNTRRLPPELPGVKAEVGSR